MKLQYKVLNCSRFSVKLATFCPVLKCINRILNLQGNNVTTPCLKKLCKHFLLDLCQISTDCENFWHKDSKEDKFFCGVLISTSPNLRQRTTVLNADVPNCYIQCNHYSAVNFITTHYHTIN